MKEILFIMGNGPSLKEIMNNDEYLNMLKKYDTFGLNAAYRVYDKYNFYPTYFGCFDFVVNESHKEEFENLILSNNSIKKFYFIGNSKMRQNMFSDNVRKSSRFQKINFKCTNINKVNSISKNFNNFLDFGGSGGNAAQIGIMLGYKKIILLGCDCNYNENLKESKKLGGYVLKINSDIKENPNYWFNDYQKKGDKFKVPFTNKFQLGSWKNLRKNCPKNVEILNCSLISKIPYFFKTDFEAIYQLDKKNILNI